MVLNGENFKFLLAFHNSVSMNCLLRFYLAYFDLILISSNAVEILVVKDWVFLRRGGSLLSLDLKVELFFSCFLGYCYWQTNR